MAIFHEKKPWDFATRRRGKMGVLIAAAFGKTQGYSQIYHG
jgi:hypothetical protein